MPKLMASIGSIAKKNKTNQGPKYNFRGIDQVYEALQPALIEHGVSVCSQVEDVKYETLAKGVRCTLTLKLFFIAADGSQLPMVTFGEAIDYSDKAAYKAMSCAYKYAVFQALCVPAGEKLDVEYEHNVPANPTEVARISGLMEAADSKAKLTNVASEIGHEGLCDSDKDELRAVYSRCLKKL
jgi:hypothetical protein